MQDEPREITTFCPRCGKPIVWSVRPFERTEQQEVSAFACGCPLSFDEWDDLGAAADEALQRMRDAEPAERRLEERGGGTDG